MDLNWAGERYIIGIRASGSTLDPYGPRTNVNLENSLLQISICDEFGENDEN
jgi:hypothetical protein